ncbi:MAG: polyprenyl synthetase family protein [Proteobacteria bacterium]|jgi:octaprenyl-diphosphate synthase|nr:polyprenyl synthetase family protein [Pseudomonadota bacterium]
MNIKIYDPKDFPAYLPKLNLLYDDLFSGGKGFRSKLIGLMAQHMGLDLRTQELLSQTIEFIHNASLLHDDLIDRSVLRRGKPAAWNKYTPEYAVLAGDYLLARVMVNLSGYGNIQLVQYTAQVISDLLEGEWLQDSLVKDMNVELSQLDRVHNLKTASLFKWCLRAPFIAQQRNEAQLHTNLEEMGTLLGQLFQRSDDLLDYNIRNNEGKAVLGDLKSGYLNSFAAYASRGLSRDQREKLRTCQTMADFQSVLGGASQFDQHVSEFDKMNEFLIQLYSHHLKTLSGYLKDSEKDLVQSLAPLTDILYWRKVSS